MSESYLNDEIDESSGKGEEVPLKWSISKDALREIYCTASNAAEQPFPADEDRPEQQIEYVADWVFCRVYELFIVNKEIASATMRSLNAAREELKRARSALFALEEVLE